MQFACCAVYFATVVHYFINAQLVIILLKTVFDSFGIFYKCGIIYVSVYIVYAAKAKLVHLAKVQGVLIFQQYLRKRPVVAFNAFGHIVSAYANTNFTIRFYGGIIHQFIIFFFFNSLYVQRFVLAVYIARIVERIDADSHNYRRHTVGTS